MSEFPDKILSNNELDTNKLTRYMRNREVNKKLIQHDISINAYTSIREAIIKTIMTHNKDSILYGSYALCLKYNSGIYDICDVDDNDIDVFVTNTKLDEFLMSLKRNILSTTTPHIINYIKKYIYNHTVNTICVNNLEIADISELTETEFNNISYEEYVYQNTKIKLLSDLAIFANHSKIITIKDHPKWDKSLKKYLFLKGKINEKIDIIRNDLIAKIYNPPNSILPIDNTFNIQKVKNTLTELKNINIKILKNEYIYAISSDVFLTNVDFVNKFNIKQKYYDRPVDIENELVDYKFHLKTTNPLILYYRFSDIKCLDHYILNDIKFVTPQIFEFIMASLLSNKYFIDKYTIQCIQIINLYKKDYLQQLRNVNPNVELKTSYCNLDKFYDELPIKLTGNLLYLEKKLINQLGYEFSWGYGLEHETEIHRKIIPDYDLTRDNKDRIIELLDEPVDNYTDKEYDNPLNDANGYHNYNIMVNEYLKNNLDKIIVNVDISFIDKLNKGILFNGAGNDVNTLKKFVQDYQNNNTEFGFAWLFDTIKQKVIANPNYRNTRTKINKLILNESIVGEISNYIGTSCGHGDLYRGSNCHFEFVTNKHLNLDINKCVDKLLSMEKQFLDYHKMIFPDAYYPDFCTHPFLLYYDSGVNMKYNKSGSIHINITLPVHYVNNNVDDSDARESLLIYNKLIHLQFARVLQFLSPLLLAYTSTPDIKAVYTRECKINNIKSLLPTDKYTLCSFRTLGSKSLFSPLPCMANLFAAFPDNRMLTRREVLSNPSSWYKILKNDGFLSHYNVRNVHSQGVDFRKDSSKGLNFGFEFRILDDFNAKNLKPILYFTTFVADYTKILSEEYPNIKNDNLKMIIKKYFLYDARYGKESINCLTRNKLFNEFVADIIMNGSFTDLSKHTNIANMFFDVFFEIPKDLNILYDNTINVNKIRNDRITVGELLGLINKILYDITTNYKNTHPNFFLYSDMMIQENINADNLFSSYRNNIEYYDFNDTSSINLQAYNYYKTMVDVMIKKTASSTTNTNTNIHTGGLLNYDRYVTNKSNYKKIN